VIANGGEIASCRVSGKLKRLLFPVTGRFCAAAIDGAVGFDDVGAADADELRRVSGPPWQQRVIGRSSNAITSFSSRVAPGLCLRKRTDDSVASSCEKSSIAPCRIVGRLLIYRALRRATKNRASSSC